MMTKEQREWKVEAGRYILMAKKYLDSKYRRDREYGNYVKRFFFGDDEITWDGNNEVWKERKAALQLPMPYNTYFMG